MANHENSDSRDYVLFDSNNITQPSFSKTFTVKDRPVCITHYNPEEGELVCLVRIKIVGCGDNQEGRMVVVKDCCSGSPVCLCCACNEMIIKKPGRYKLMKQGVPNNADISYNYISSRYI